LGVIERVVEEGVRTGVLIPLNPRRFTYLLLGACNWMHRWYRPGGEWTPDAIAEEIITVLENGCLQEQPKTNEASLLREVQTLREEVRQLQDSVQLDRGKTLATEEEQTSPGHSGHKKADHDSVCVVSPAFAYCDTVILVRAYPITPSILLVLIGDVSEPKLYATPPGWVVDQHAIVSDQRLLGGGSTSAILGADSYQIVGVLCEFYCKYRAGAGVV
jgi:hypothetical protein